MSANVRKSAKKHGQHAQAIAALLSTPTLEKAAAQCGVAEVTIRRWLREPAFAAAVRAAGQQLIDGAVAHLQGALLEASECLRRNLACGRPSVEVAAARAIWEAAGTQQQIALLNAQIQALEQRVNAPRK